jgi:hypothetical protein
VEGSYFFDSINQVKSSSFSFGEVLGFPENQPSTRLSHCDEPLKWTPLNDLSCPLIKKKLEFLTCKYMQRLQLIGVITYRASKIENTQYYEVRI